MRAILRGCVEVPLVLFLLLGLGLVAGSSALMRRLK